MDNDCMRCEADPENQLGDGREQQKSSVLENVRERNVQSLG
jgi:hypothetical protein